MKLTLIQWLIRFFYSGYDFKKALNGVKMTSFSSVVIAILQLAQVSILARYLEPSDFGLMAIFPVVIGLSALFMDVGVSSLYCL
jgi:O-antigen/teichoic acid export membrane protein